MLDKTYRPETVETRQYEAWEEAGAFAAEPTSSKRPYTIMLPPPNVTGSLHMGHALSYTLQDVLIRFERMRGRDALWQPGTDHAGIATEIVVSNQLAAEGKTRADLGRPAFIDRVWKWKAESGGTITRQLRRLGASLDWSRDRFTMDAGLSAAVRKVFVTLYREGLIYRDKRLVNWDPVMHTVISDLEVDNRETRGSLWHIRYPIEGEPGRFVVVATTRPETMLGDTGVAVHPDDPRHADLVGKTVRLPLVGRLIPIVADEYADPEKGSGAVKITPAHDFNDFEVGRRHGLAAINIFDRDAHLNDAVPEKYRGLERFAARKQVLADLEAEGLIEKVEDQVLMVPHHDRSGEIIEPWLTDQWFCNAAELAKPAIEAVERGRTQFVPRQWENTFFEWMRNIQPWCISRQLWWGHQIPAWYGPDGACLRRRERGGGGARRGGALRQRGRAAAGRGRARHLVLVGAVAVFDARLARADAGAEALLPRRRAGDRVRHHLFLGRPHDDAGAAFHGRRAVPHGLHPRAGARRARPENVEVARQHHRPARPDRPLRLRRAALHAGGAGLAGARHQARREPRRKLAQFRDKAVERGALRRDERLRAGRRISIREAAG